MKVPKWESQAQAVGELLLAAFRECQKLSLVTTDTSTDLAQRQAALDAWDVAVAAYTIGFRGTRIPPPPRQDTCLASWSTETASHA